jgi:hypothetical protein
VLKDQKEYEHTMLMYLPGRQSAAAFGWGMNKGEKNARMKRPRVRSMEKKGGMVSSHIGEGFDERTAAYWKL